MKYFLTGGAGFIGSHIAEKLLKETSTQKVYIYDNFSSSTEHNLDFISDTRLIIHQGDLCDREKLASALNEDVDIVFHLAANPDISKAESNPSLDFEQGTILTNNLLEVIRLKKIKRIIYTSGSGVYGEKDIDFDENYGPLIPISPYAANKIASEALISSYSHMFNICAVVFRFANVVGKRQTHGVGYDFIHKLNDNKYKLDVLGDGNQCKSYIHIDDVIKGIFAVIDSDNHTLYDVYNITTNDSITVKDIAKIAIEVNGMTDTEINYLGGDRGWNGDVPKIKFNSNKIRNRYKWHNRYSSIDAIKKSLREILEDIKNG
ncbi:MAG: NAD-dependent epimerase/dehydratase family protein [Pseudomonadota bacterium]|nr:NAD-dependent epimerase/dehydratase family protein [Pseudomonadota bacterium]